MADDRAHEDNGLQQAAAALALRGYDKDAISKALQAQFPKTPAFECRCVAIAAERRAAAPEPEPAEAPVEPEPVELSFAEQVRQQDREAAQRFEAFKADAAAKRSAEEQRKNNVLGIPCMFLDNLAQPADASNTLFPAGLHERVPSFFSRDGDLRPRCLDVLLALYRMWQLQGRALSKVGQYVIAARYADICRQLGYKSYGGAQLAYVKDALDRLNRAGLLACQKVDGQLAIRLDPELSPQSKHLLKPISFEQFRAVRSAAKKLAFMQASIQVAANNRGELKAATLIERLGYAKRSQPREERWLQAIATALNEAKLDDDHILHVQLAETAARDGLKLQFHRVPADGKATPPKKRSQPQPQPRQQPPPRPQHTDISPEALASILKRAVASVAAPPG